MCRVNLSALILVSAPHSFAKPFRPACTCFGRKANVEPHTCVDVPQTQRCKNCEDDDVSRNQKPWIEVRLLLRYMQNLMRPWEDVILSDEDEKQKQEPHRKKCDVA